MKSRALAKFWNAYGTLDVAEKNLARKAYSIWRVNPYHPSLAFKKVGSEVLTSGTRRILYTL